MKPTGTEKAFAALICEGEDWLMGRILGYAQKQDYTRYTSTLREAWRLSIEGLSRPLIELLESGQDIPDPSPDTDFSEDHSAAFGVLEARRHRARGINIGLFLGLFKFYRRTYQDLVGRSGLSPEQQDWCNGVLDRYFDLVELGFTSEWAQQTKAERLAELETANRALANEKNKYLTILESLAPPVVFIDAEGRVDNINFAASRLFRGSVSPGSLYYGPEVDRSALPWLAEELEAFIKSGEEEVTFEKGFGANGEMRAFEVKFARMLDVSRKFTGVTVILNEITARRKAQREREEVITQLQEALGNVKTLRGLIPICASCKRIRSDSGYWHQIEAYVREHSGAEFSHGICPECMELYYPETSRKIKDGTPDAPRGQAPAARDR